MKKTNSLVLKLLVLVMIAAFTITCTSCVSDCSSTTSGSTTTTAEGTGTTSETTNVVTDETGAVVLGEGKAKISFTVIFADGTQNVYAIQTDKTKLSDALLEHDLIEVEESTYGLYVTSVCGVSYDYTADGKWWELKVGGVSAMQGISEVDVIGGRVYSFEAADA